MDANRDGDFAILLRLERRDVYVISPEHGFDEQIVFGRFGFSALAVRLACLPPGPVL